MSTNKKRNKMLCLSTLGKTLNSSKKLQTPAEVVQRTRSLLLYSKKSLNAASQTTDELNSLVRELKLILYGDDDSEPSEEACAQLTEEFFREDTLRLLIIFLPKLNLEARKDATQVVASLQRQPLPSRFQASGYLEVNLDLVDILICGYILEPSKLQKLFGYIQLPSFDIAADAADAFKDLLTRHKSTVSESLSKNYSWFFTEFNEKLLKSENYITKRQAVKLLGSILLDRSNSGVMRRYVSSKDNLIILMNLLRDTSRSIQIDAFHVFKLFVANEEKPVEIVSILVTNRNKLLRLLGAFVYTDDQVFETDKDQVINELAVLDLEH